MSVYLVSQFLNNWCLRKKSTNPWAQVIGQEYMSILDMKYSLGHSTLNILHSPLYFERLLWKLAPETQNQNTLKNPPCRLIFSYSDWKPKQKPSSDFFFFLESTTTEDSESPHTGHLVQLSWEICPVFPICSVQQLLVKAPEEILCNLLSQQSWKKFFGSFFYELESFSKLWNPQREQ